MSNRSGGWAGAHYIGALGSRLLPPAVQLLLIVLVAQQGTLSDVGRLALASAVSFTCGGLAEIGLQTSLSVPRPISAWNTPRFARRDDCDGEPG